MSTDKRDQPAPDERKGDEAPKKGPVDPGDRDQKPGPARETPDAPNPDEHPGGPRG